jgi:hypothetical protein
MLARLSLWTGSQAIAVGPGGEIYFLGQSCIRRIGVNGFVQTFAGKPDSPGYRDGAGTTAQFSNPNGLAIDSAGNLFVADSDNHLIYPGNHSLKHGPNLGR